MINKPVVSMISTHAPPTVTSVGQLTGSAPVVSTFCARHMNKGFDPKLIENNPELTVIGLEHFQNTKKNVEQLYNAQGSWGPVATMLEKYKLGLKPNWPRTSHLLDQVIDITTAVGVFDAIVDYLGKKQ